MSGTELVACALFEALHAAKLDVRLPARFVRRHTGVQVLLYLLLDVEANLFVEAAFERVHSRQRSQAPPACPDEAHERRRALTYPTHDVSYGIVASST
jgi:hypothetical protein